MRAPRSPLEDPNHIIGFLWLVIARDIKALVGFYENLTEAKRRNGWRPFVSL